MKYLSFYRSMSLRIITTSLSICQMLQLPHAIYYIMQCYKVNYKHWLHYIRGIYQRTAMKIDEAWMGETSLFQHLYYLAIALALLCMR